MCTRLWSAAAHGWEATATAGRAAPRAGAQGFYITSLATAGTGSGGGGRWQWAVVMSRHAGFAKQCLELDFQYPSEGIHRRWDAGAPRPRAGCMQGRRPAAGGALCFA